MTDLLDTTVHVYESRGYFSGRVRAVGVDTLIVEDGDTLRIVSVRTDTVRLRPYPHGGEVGQ